MKRASALLALFGAACGGASHGGGGGTQDAGPYIAGFDPGAAPAGFTRYVTPVVNVDPGSSEIWCQYVAPAFSQAQDIVSVQGEQSVGGHHIAVYATTFTAPVGTSRFCNTEDMLSIRFLGAIGAEGSTSLGSDLPPGVVFRINAGEALMFNTHFINTTAQAMQGQGVIDIQWQSPQPGTQVAGFFTNVSDQFDLQPALPSPQSTDNTCTLHQDMNFFAFGNHMHQYGFSVYSELIHPDGGSVVLRNDPNWTAEMEFNPTFSTWQESAAVAAQPGDKIHTHCEWINSSSSALRFPSEMCVGIGLFLPGGPEIDCVDGQWPASTSSDGG